MGLPWVRNGFARVRIGFALGSQLVRNGFAMGLQWVRLGFALGLQWVCMGLHGLFAVGLHWFCYGFALGLLSVAFRPFPWLPQAGSILGQPDVCSGSALGLPQV